MRTLADTIEMARKGDSPAQEALVNALSYKMYILCMRYVRNREDAEERMQDGFCKALRSLSSFSYVSDAGFHAWIKTIMIRECIEQIRNENAFNKASESEAYNIGFEADVFSKMAKNEFQVYIARLPVGCRTIFNLRVDGHPHQEIARLLGIKLGTVWSQLSKAKSLLQKMLTSKQSDHVRNTSDE